MNRTALLYARISVTDKNVPKVANQIADLRRLARAHGFQIGGEYIDDGLSAAKAENRPEFDRLMRDLPGHPGVVLLATEEARFARNEIEKAGLMLACASAGATWETIRDGRVDPATASGALMATLRGGIDAFESRRKAERQKAANQHRRNAGLHYTNGPAPFGWNSDRVTIAEPEAALIREGTLALLAGRSIHSIVKSWRESGVNPPRSETWTRVSVLMTLRRWRNAAVVAYKDDPLRDESASGKVKPYRIGEWSPIVSVAEIEAARSILMAKAGSKRVASHLCSGIAICSCGAYMIASGSNGTRAYMCSARIRGISGPGTVHAGIKAELLEAKVRDEVIRTYFTSPVGTGAAEEEARTLTALYERRASAQAAVSRLLDQVEVGTFKNSEIQPRVASRRTEIDALDRDIARLAAKSAHAAMMQESLASLWVQAADEVGTIAKPGSWRPGSSLIRSMQRKGMTREEAINRAIKIYWHENRDEPAARRELGRRFDDLDLEQRRNLVRSLLSIQVAPGRGLARVVIAPLQGGHPR